MTTRKTRAKTPAKPRPRKTAAKTLQNDPLAWMEERIEDAPEPAPASRAQDPDPEQVVTAQDQDEPEQPTSTPIDNSLAAEGERNTEMTAETDRKTASAAKGSDASDLQYWEKKAPSDLLDFLVNPIMIADANYDIRFVNASGYAMFGEMQADIRKDLPNFTSRDIVGKNIDLFHKNPAHQRAVMAGMTEPHAGQFTIGGRHLSFMATPIYNSANELTNVLVEWKDLTESTRSERQNAFVREQFDLLLSQMSHMSEQHELGDIDVFVDVDAIEMKEVADAARLVNEMVQAHIDTKKLAMGVFDAFGNGDFDADVPPLPGKKVFINNIVNSVRTNFQNLTHEITSLSDAIVNGQLDVQVDVSKFSGGYRQIVESFERAFGSLNGAFSVISEQVTQVSQTVDQMSNVSQALSTNAQIASSSVDEVSSSAEETDAQVRANAEAAQKATTSVNSAAGYASEGAGKIREMVSAMDGIKTSSQDIGKIIKVIDEIAFQTNLLALNAAVEAARAGQHGRGFAVVAQEVRNLAGRSAKAARETSDLIEGASSRVNSGVRIADETAEAFTKINSEIEQVKTMVQEIDKSSDEQARGVAQITQAISEIAKTALASSQQADELASTSAQMSAATQQMNSEVARFKLRSNTGSVGSAVSLDQLSPELLGQIQKMMGNTPAATKANGKSLDKDNRGYGPF